MYLVGYYVFLIIYFSVLNVGCYLNYNNNGKYYYGKMYSNCWYRYIWFD